MAINLSDFARQRHPQYDLARPDFLTDSANSVDFERPFSIEQFVNSIRAHDYKKDIHSQSTSKLRMLSKVNAKQKEA
jgi:hypothetical protein